MIKKRVLIIGSNGMLGQRVVELFKNKNDVELHLASLEEKSFFPDLTYNRIDICDKKAIKKLLLSFIPDIVLNLAAYTNVDKSETEKELCWNINVNAVENIAKYCLSANSHLVHISSDYVFDGINGPYSENDLPNPISYYGRSKLAGENVIKRFNIPSTIIRTNVLFGTAKYGRPDFVKWVVNSLQKKQEISIVTDQINNPTFLDDLALGIDSVYQFNKVGLFNIGGSEFMNRYDFTLKIADYFKLDKTLIKPILTETLIQPAKRPLNSGLINLKAITELAYKPRSLYECFSIMENEINENN